MKNTSLFCSAVLLIILITTPFFCEAQRVSYKKKKGKYGITINGRLATEYLYTDVLELKNGKLQVQNENGIGLYDSNGNQSLECIYDSFEEDYFGNITTKKGDKIGRTNEQGVVIIPCEYSEILNRGKDKYIVTQKGKQGVYSKGELVVQCSYDALRLVQNENVIVKRMEMYGVINFDNKIILPFEYDNIDHYSPEDGGLVKLNGKWGSLDSSNKFSEVSGRLVFRQPEEMARYKNCEEFFDDADKRKACSDRAMLERIYGNVRYPPEARKRGIEGMVVVSFLISPKGEIHEPEVVKFIGGGCDEESLRVVKAMPNWIPGKVEGEPVWTIFNLPIKFRLE